MVSVSGNQTNNKVTASSSTSTNNKVEATNNLAKYYSEISKDWAIGEGLIQNIDYSSKTYALQSKEYANDAKESMEITGSYMDNAISNIQTAETNALNNIITQEESALSTVNQGVEQLNTTITDGLENINTSAYSGVGAIETLKANSIDEITTNKESALNDITTAELNALNHIDEDFNNATSEINTNRTNTLAQISTLANESISDINAVGKSYDNLTHKNITNCLLEVPQRIKYTLENGILTIKAGTVVIVPYGTEDLTSTYPVGSTFLNDNFKVYDTQYSDGKFFVWVEIVNDVSTGGGTTNASELWTLSLNIPKNGFAASYTSKAVVDTPITYGMVYNTTTNIISSHGADSTVAIGTNISFPLLITQSTANGYIASTVYQVFNGMGYIGSAVWVDKGVKGLIPNGRNEDGSLKNVEYTTEKLVTRGYLGASTLWNLCINASGYIYGCPHSYYYAQETQPAIISQTQIWYKPSENIHYYSNWENTSTFDVFPMFNVFDVVWGDANTITSFNPKQPFRAVDYNDFSNTPHIIDTYVNGTSGYRIWSDGYCEQWGYMAHSEQTQTISLLKNMANTDYTVFLQAFYNAVPSGTHYFCLGAKTASAFTKYSVALGGFTGCYWRACGYIA